ncbi:MAG TPA: hypothetical protein DHV16_07300 [Nitrospiraceae bacterium]|nr:hypothetical protein [Nitrospiraceae bacterium]
MPILNPANKAIIPSLQTVKDGTYSPLSRPLFIYVSKKSVSKPEVKEFVDYYLKNVEKLSKQVKYVPLPANAYMLAKERFAKMKTGSMFGGEEKVGLKIEDLLKMEEKKK